MASSSATTVTSNIASGLPHATKMKRFQNKKSSVVITPSMPSIPQIQAMISRGSSPSLESSSNNPSKSSKQLSRGKEAFKRPEALQEKINNGHHRENLAGDRDSGTEESDNANSAPRNAPMAKSILGARNAMSR